jgi:2-polyprenyl-3-methyl-5-hydroxy-6-metoxy-1,4-benzoquinol methylase
MWLDSTNADWQRLGEIGPYWAVINQDEYRQQRTLSGAARREFFESGERYVAGLWRVCAQEFGDAFAPRRTLDFGCGVGRVALALAKRCDSVVAVDVAESMLAEARRIVADQHVSNVEVRTCDDVLSGIHGPFDLVHSVLVFQHVPSSRGLLLVRRLLDLAGSTGVVVLHVLFHDPFDRPLLVRLTRAILRPLRRPLGRMPEVQMNAYSMNEVLKSIHDAGFQRTHIEFTNHAGHLGALCIGRRGDAIAAVA